jgi:hypothetical protein
MRPIAVLTACVTFFLFVASGGAWAQASFQGGLRGAVKDAGGAVPGVTITLVDEATNLSRNTVSNEVGEYAFAALTPGTYSVRAILTGFKTFERKGLTVGAQQFITLDLLMEVGAIEEQVTVIGSAPIIETSNASIGGTIDNQTLESLPMLNRNSFMSAVITVPTVQAQGDPYFSRMEDQSNGSLVSLGGGPLRANDYLLDGVSTTDMTNRTESFINPEAIEELKVQVHTYDAEMGRSGGGIFNTVGRSGTNVLHGSGFGQVRPNWSQNQPYFQELAGEPKLTSSYYRYFGGSAGGPIAKDRTFYFGAWEGYQTGTARGTQLYLPTAAELHGDFSHTFDPNGKLIVIYDPATTTLLPNGTYTRQPFQNNIIPAYRINPVAAAIAKLLPSPQTQSSAAGGVPNDSVTVPAIAWANQYYGKLTHKVSQKDSFSVLYMAQPDDEGDQHYWQGVSPFADPNEGLEIRRAYILAVNNTFTPNNTTVVTLRYGYTRYHDNEVPYSGYDLTSLGFPASFANAVTYQKFPDGTIEGYGQTGNNTFGNRAYQDNLHTSWMVNGSVSKLVGRQTIKYGGDFRRLGLLEAGPDYSSGNFTFAKAWTQQNPNAPNIDSGNGFASFLLGIPTGTTPVTVPLNFFVKYYGAYIQDDFRATDALTLNFGLRYEYQTGMGAENNTLTVGFDPNAVNPLSSLTGLNLKGGLIYAGQNGAPTTQGDPSKTKFSPRGGFAWTVGPKTVIRGGYGLFWAPYVFPQPGSTNYGQTGYTATNQIFQQSDNVFPSVFLDNPYPNGLQQPTGNSSGLLTGVGSSLYYVDQNQKSPHVQQYSVEMQRELPGGMAVTVGYVGARGDNLSWGGTGTGNLNINTLTPQQIATYGAQLQSQVSNPFYGIAQAGAFSRSPTIAYGQLLRPFPEFGDILDQQASGAISRYNAAVFQLNKRMSHGWGGRASFTWSRLNDSQFGQGSFYSPSGQKVPLDSRNPGAEYSRSLLDVPERVVVAPIVELPFGASKRWLHNGLGDLLAGGWMVSAVATFDAGSPINVTQADNTGSFGGVQRPNLTGVSPQTSGDTLSILSHFINPAAYMAAPAFMLGTAPRTDPNLRTPSRGNLDLVFSKNVSLARSMTVQFRAEILNATNTPKFVGPAQVFGLSTFGEITTQAGFSRTSQFTLRFNF